MLEDSQDATLGRRRSQPAAPDAIAQVEADPGAVFDEYDADSVDELVASEDEAEADGPDGCTADDVAVAAMFDDGLEAPEADAASAGERDAPRDAPRDAGPDASEDRTEPRDGLLAGLTAPDADGSSGAAVPESSTAGSGEPAGVGAAEPSGPDEPAPDDLADDAEVAAALEAAESVHEGELPDEIPFE